jgi:hypothetical protein
LFVTPVLSVVVLLLSNPFFSFQALRYDIGSLFYVLSESYWLLEETAGILIRPVGVVYMFSVSLLFVLLARQVQVGEGSSFKGVLSFIPSFFVGCAGCSAGILGFVTATGLSILPVSSFVITYSLIAIGFIVSVYSLVQIGDPTVCSVE